MGVSREICEGTVILLTGAKVHVLIYDQHILRRGWYIGKKVI